MHGLQSDMAFPLSIQVPLPRSRWEFIVHIAMSVISTRGTPSLSEVPSLITQLQDVI